MKRNVFEALPSTATGRLSAFIFAFHIFTFILIVSLTPAEAEITVFEDNFESGSLRPEWTVSSSWPDGRIQANDAHGAAVGAFALMMDTAAFSIFNLNEAVFSVDLSDAESATLSFFQASFDDEIDVLPSDFTGAVNGDGVCISDDGVHWRTVFTVARSLSGVWHPVTVDLGAEAAAAGMTLGPNFRIKFQQYDNFPIAFDGRGFDEILVTAEKAQAIEIVVDIKPGSDSNKINCKNANGVIAVAILTTADFDATIVVDAESVRFGPNGAEETHRRKGRPTRHEEDVDGDGRTDLVFHFRLGDAGLACGDTEAIRSGQITEATLSGQTTDGRQVSGMDTIKTTNRGAKAAPALNPAFHLVTTWAALKLR